MTNNKRMKQIADDFITTLNEQGIKNLIVEYTRLIDNETCMGRSSKKFNTLRNAATLALNILKGRQ